VLPEVFRHESFLLTLPFHAALPDAYIQHFKDAPGAPATRGWEHFDLNRYLGLGGDRLPRDIPSTTLMFAVARGEPVRPWGTVEEAWPRLFQWHRSSQSLPRRLLTGRWIRVSRDLVRPPRLRASVSVVQAIRLAPRPGSEPDEWRWSQMDRALGHLNDLLSGVAAVRRDPEISSVGLRDLPPLVLGFGWELYSDGRRSQVEWRAYMAHDRLPWVTPTMSLEEAELAGWIATAKDYPLKPAGDFLLGAWSSAQRGRFTHAVAEAGTAVELLISASLRVAAPHHGYSKEKLGSILDGDFAGRVRHHFAPMFGYATDPGRSTDPLGRWWRDSYLLRNRVIHRGHRPEEAEAVQAIEAAEDLHHDLAERVSGDPRLHALHLPVPPEVIAAAEEHGHGPVPRSFERRLRRPS
jgi:hypothetical protein